jgi:16S rRNA (guanine1516-N2)-methyltransferase
LSPKPPRYLAGVVGPDADTELLLNIARQVAIDRVVVKRPDHAPSLKPVPRSHHEGKLVRYDVYDPLRDSSSSDQGPCQGPGQGP